MAANFITDEMDQFLDRHTGERDNLNEFIPIKGIES